jgi:hypothetical protein
MRTALILAAALTLPPATALAQLKPLPWEFDPITTPNLPLREIVTADGYAGIWVYQKDGKLHRYEAHCTREICNIPYLLRAGASYLINPSEAFWARAKTSSCFDPKGYWPSGMEQRLCNTVRLEWAAWGLK